MKIGLIRITGILSGSAGKKKKKRKTHVDMHKRLHFLRDIILNTFHIRVGGRIFFFFSIQGATQKIEYGDSKIDC